MLQITRRLTLAAIALSVCTVLPASGQTLTEDFKLAAVDGAHNDNFGWAIDNDNGIIAVGSVSDSDNGGQSGSVYLYDALTGTQLAKLIPGDGQAGDHFGQSVSIDSGIVAVGTFRDDDNGNDSGSVYLFNASTGIQIVKILPDDGSQSALFGSSISIANGIIAVGANGANGSTGSAYLFDAATGIQITKLTASDGQTGDFFGSSIAISNGIVAVGANGNDDNGDGSGSAYLFDAATGTQLLKLLPNDGTQGAQFGLSVAIDNDIVVVGARLALGNNISGAAYLFNTSTGKQLLRLLPNDAAMFDNFGFSVSIDNGIVAVGALRSDINSIQTGSAYIFDASTGAQINKLIASDGASSDDFGYAVSISNGIVIVGAPKGPSGVNPNSGAAYIFDYLPNLIQQPQSTVVNAGETASFEITLANDAGASFQWRRDGVDLTDNANITGANTATLQIIADPSDSGYYDCAYSNQFSTLFTTQAALGVRLDPNACVADLTDDGILDFFDVSAFLQAFGAGCP